MQGSGTRDGGAAGGEVRPLAVGGVILRGHRVASGAADDSPYPAGSIEMQAPHFRERGLDLSGCRLATLNIGIHPRAFVLRRPQHTFRGVRWAEEHPPEDFSLTPCGVDYDGRRYRGVIYHPHPATKRRHHQDPSTVEVIAEPIPGLTYGSEVTLIVDPAEVEIVDRPEG